MTRHISRLLISSTIILGAVACGDATTPSPASTLSQSALGAALSTVPIGYGDLSTSYVGVSASVGTAGLWVGGGEEASFDHVGLMGGGLGDDFIGGLTFHEGEGHHGPFGNGLRCAGAFDVASGRVVCPAETHDGVTIKRSASYALASGAVQQAFDSLTNTVNLQAQVAGTRTFDRAADSIDASGHEGGEHDWGRGRGSNGRLLGDTSTILTATTTINSSSSRTVGGLAPASTKRTVDGASAGMESTTGTSSRGSFTATRAVGDTTVGVIVPVVPEDTKSYPTAGTVIRQIQATLKYTGENAVTMSRREVVTYDGSATAKVVITESGTTKNCTRPLPHGALSCS